jgi:hypothetical protein
MISPGHPLDEPVIGFVHEGMLHVVTKLGASWYFSPESGEWERIAEAIPDTYFDAWERQVANG